MPTVQIGITLIGLLAGAFSGATLAGALEIAIGEAGHEAMGFAVTGDFQALPSDPCKDEIRMRHPLGGG